MHTMLLLGASAASGLLGLQVRLLIVPAVAPLPAPAVALGAHAVFKAELVPVFVQVKVMPVTVWPGLNAAGTLFKLADSVVVVSLTTIVAVAVSQVVVTNLEQMVYG